MKPKADRRYLPAFDLILLGLTMPLVWHLAQQWKVTTDIFSGPGFARVLGLSLAVIGFALLAPHYHHHHGRPSRRRTGSEARLGPSAERIRRPKGDAP